MPDNPPRVNDAEMVKVNKAVEVGQGIIALMVPRDFDHYNVRTSVVRAIFKAWGTTFPDTRHSSPSEADRNAVIDRMQSALERIAAMNRMENASVGVCVSIAAEALRSLQSPPSGGEKRQAQLGDGATFGPAGQKRADAVVDAQRERLRAEFAKQRELDAARDKNSKPAPCSTGKETPAKPGDGVREKIAEAFAKFDVPPYTLLINDILSLLQPGETVGMRPEVLAFAHAMEAQLRTNDHKPGWKKDQAGGLWDRLLEEVRELEVECLDRAPHYDTSKVLKEAADVANFAMMIADVCGALVSTERREEEKAGEASSPARAGEKAGAGVRKDASISHPINGGMPANSPDASPAPSRDYLKCRLCGSTSADIDPATGGVLRLLEQGWRAVNQRVDYECPECAKEGDGGNAVVPDDGRIYVPNIKSAPSPLTEGLNATVSEAAKNAKIVQSFADTGAKAAIHPVYPETPEQERAYWERCVRSNLRLANVTEWNLDRLLEMLDKEIAFAKSQQAELARGNAALVAELEKARKK